MVSISKVTSSIPEYRIYLGQKSHFICPLIRESDDPGDREATKKKVKKVNKTRMIMKAELSMLDQQNLVNTEACSLHKSLANSGRH